MEEEVVNLEDIPAQLVIAGYAIGSVFGEHVHDGRIHVDRLQTGLLILEFFQGDDLLGECRIEKDGEFWWKGAGVNVED